MIQALQIPKSHEAIPGTARKDALGSIPATCLQDVSSGHPRVQGFMRQEIPPTSLSADSLTWYLNVFDMKNARGINVV